MSTNFPTFSQVPDPKKGKHVRDVLRDYVSNDAVWKEINDYVVNGGICGHKVMDLAAMVDIITGFDHVGGKRLAPFNLNKFAIGNQLKMVLRERFELDSHWKIIGLSKRVLLAAPPSSESQPSE